MFEISEHPFCRFYPLLKQWGKRLLIFPTTPVMLATNCKDFAIDFSPAIFATIAPQHTGRIWYAVVLAAA